MFYNGIEVREADPRKLGHKERVAYIRWVLAGRERERREKVRRAGSLDIPPWLRRQGE